MFNRVKQKALLKLKI